jgi:hypothetical protein
MEQRTIDIGGMISMSFFEKMTYIQLLGMA